MVLNSFTNEFLANYEIPLESISVYKSLYLIEITLRELIITEFNSLDPRWIKTRLPNDIREKIKEGRLYEYNIKWTELVPHHPLYYIDFPDIKKIIERKDNWDDIFKRIFSDKDVFVSLLRELEPIRNKIAHHRIITQSDTQVVNSCLTSLISSIGEGNFYKFSRKQTTCENIVSQINSLIKFAEDCYIKCKKVNEIPSIDEWLKIKQSWWFDSNYLNFDIDVFSNFFTIIEEYYNFPRYRGVGIEIEERLNASNFDHHYKVLMSGISSIFDFREDL